MKHVEDLLLWALLASVLIATIVAAGLGVAELLQPVGAQAEKERQQWQLGWLPVPDDTHRSRVDVIDTGSVCLYVVQSFAREVDHTLPRATDKSLSVGLAVAITSVPKTQLPPGKGCQ